MVDRLHPSLFADLLALPSIRQQMTRLRAAKLLTADGLAAMLDEAERLVGVDPDQTQKLARLCEQACLSADLFALLPRTAYLQAQVHAIKGEFATARGLIEMARRGYEDLGLTLEALRTNVGLMRVLGETGNYAEALQTGQRALVQIGASTDPPGAAEPAEYQVVAAMLLQNCGFCYEQIARAEEALAAYAAAEARYQTLGMIEQQAQIRENRGEVLKAQGRVQEALAAFMGARQIYAEAGLDFYQAQTLINIGEAHLLLSNYMASLQAFEQATRLFATLGDTVDRYILLRHMGDAYLALNLHAEALDAYGRAKAGLQAAGLTLHYALTLWGLGVTQIACQQLLAAEQALTEAAVILRELDNRPLLSALLLEQSRLAEAIVGTRSPTGVIQHLAQEALALVADSDWAIQKSYAYLRLTDLAWPDVAIAEEWLAAAQHAAAQVELPPLRYRLHQRWGQLRWRQGDTLTAQRHLEQAIAEIEELRSTLVQERLRASFLDDKTAAYQDLVQLHLQRGDPASVAAAFGVAERAKARALADLLTGAIPTRLEEPTDTELAAQLQACQAELNAIYNGMLSRSAETSPSTALLYKERAAEVTQTISHLRLRWMLGQEPPLAATPHPALPDVQKLALPSDTVLVAYHIVEDEILAFVCTAAEIRVVRQLATTTQLLRLLQRLKAQWASMRNEPAFVARHQQQLEQIARHLLHQIYNALMAPLEALLPVSPPNTREAVRKLVIVPHRFLHQLPFHALHDGAHYLVERYAISYAPSALVFALCQQRPLRQTGLALAVATPDAQIPAAVREAQQVVQHLRPFASEVRLLVQAEATLAALSALTPACGWLHLACHGLFRADNPIFSAIQLHDGWLTATQVAQLTLKGALVTLSACESGRSQMMGGEESIGLVYAFLSAGAASLLVSQWLVQDELTACLMDHWYSQLATATDLAAALRNAQLAILAEQPHPYYWAPFVLVGQRIGRGGSS